MKTVTVHEHVPHAPASDATPISHAARQLRQFMCGLHGHDTLLHFEGRHVSLVCTSCGYESPGWTVPGAPITAGSADAGRRVPATGSRRIA